jgi:hypothetical protein
MEEWGRRNYTELIYLEYSSIMNGGMISWLHGLNIKLYRSFMSCNRNELLSRNAYVQQR